MATTSDLRQAHRELQDATNWLFGFALVHWAQTRDPQYQVQTARITEALGILGEYVDEATDADKDR